MTKIILLSMALSILVVSPAPAMTLSCGIEKANVEGRIGLRISSSGYIKHVYPNSPAEAAGIKPKDRVVLVDGQKNNIDNISGEPGTAVSLEVKRQKELFSVEVPRVDRRILHYYGLASSTEQLID